MTPVEGYWDVIEDDTRLCGGFHSCDIVCGSSYEPPAPYSVDYDIDEAHKIEETNWGITNFDNVASALLTVF